jgi:hypothetical protein
MITTDSPPAGAGAPLALITAVTFVIAEGCQWYALTDDRDHDARYSGGVRKQDPGRQDPGMP